MLCHSHTLFTLLPVPPDLPHVREDQAHKSIITYISHLTLSNGADRYVTCGRDGLVKIWNAKVRSLGLGS